MRRTINPRMVVLARESRGLTQSELAERLDYHQAKVSKIESGQMAVGSETLQKLSAALGYPETFFYQDDDLHGIDTSMLFHRKRNLPAKVLGRIHALVNIRRMHIARLLMAADLTNARTVPQFDASEFKNGPEDVARAVRATWLLPRGPVQSMTKAIEDAGGIIVRCDFGTRLVDAISQWTPGLPPLFFVNADVPGDRLRWSLAHELGHLVMHRTISPDLESEADTFAGGLLLPADEITPYFMKGVNLSTLATLKPYWKVSMSALLMRAKGLGATTDRHARFLWMQFGKAGYRLREPPSLDVPVEQPRLLSDLLDMHRRQLGYTTTELAKLLHMDEAEARTTYLPSQRPLRAVN